MKFNLPSLTLIGLLLAPSTVFANTPISQQTVNSQGLYPFVLASRPKWWFGIPGRGLCLARTAPCYPDEAVNPTTGEQNPGASLCLWPNANCGCKYPSESGERNVKGRSFPHYYIVNQCSSTEVRVGFWVYYPKDGHILTGHRHDWEYYVVIWSKQSNGDYIRTSQVFSYHGDRLQVAWADAETVDDNLEVTATGQGNHAHVYPAWSKHSNFPDRNVETCGALLQSTKLAYRSNDWWYYADESDLVLAEASTRIGGWIEAIGQAGSWGDASGWPSTRGGDGRICGLNGTESFTSSETDTSTTSPELASLGLDAMDTAIVSELDIDAIEAQYGPQTLRRRSYEDGGSNC